jgi:choline-sulfatase
LPGLPLLGEVMSAGGYQTRWVGKWHVPHEYPLELDAIPGFTQLPIAGRSTESGGYPVTVRGRPDRWDHNLGVYVDEPVAETAAAFLRERHESPFLLVVALMNPHDICFPSEYQRSGVDESVLPPLPENFEVSPDEPELLTDTRFTHEGSCRAAVNWDARDWRFALSAYYRFTEYADKAVGIVLRALMDTGLDHSTVVFFTSDHGEGGGSHQWLGKLSLHEEAIGVPFIVSWRGHTPPGVADRAHLVSGLDIFTTIASYAGITPPPGLEGIDLRWLIENPSEPGRRYVCSALYPVSDSVNNAGRMLRGSRYKYVVYSRGARREQFFDLEADPGERQNRVADPSLRSELERHRRALTDWLEASGDPFTPG